jgi:chorismate mutase
MALRGIRGAITVDKNAKKAVISATEELLKQMVEINRIKTDDIASVIFSTTVDLDAVFPAAAARNLGWIYTPLLCTHEIDAPGGVKRCIRVLMHVNTLKPQKAMRHVYLRGAEVLRPDLSKKGNYSVG